MRFPSATLLLAGGLAFAGCEIPTDAPILEQRWIIPAERTTIGVDELLPTGVTVSGSNFDVSVDPFSISRALGDVCPGCAAVNGLVAPKPAFTATFSVTESLPADVSGVGIASGSIQITIQNGFGFDPIRPAGGNTGTITVTLTDGPGGAQIGEITLDGATDALSPGSQLTRTMTLATSDISSTLNADVTVNSPSGDAVMIDTSEELDVSATVTSLLVSSATVDVADRDVSLDPVALDVEDIDVQITDRIQSGSIILDITNPFGVGVGGQLTIDQPGQRISKTFTVGEGATSTVTLSYTGDELRSFLGKPDVTLTGDGTVSSSAGAVTVTPDQEMTIDGKIDLTIQIGG